MVDGSQNSGEAARGRGIFSEDDREYLRGNKEYEHRQSEHKRINDIRERFQNALKDIQLLGEGVDREERQRILDLGDPEVKYDVDLGLGWMLALSHRLAVDMRDDMQGTHDPHGHKSRSFELRLQEGLEQAYLDEGLVLEDLSLEVESRQVPGLEELQERVAKGGPVSLQAVSYLLETDQIDSTAYLEFLAEQLDVETEFEDEVDLSDDE